MQTVGESNSPARTLRLRSGQADGIRAYVFSISNRESATAILNSCLPEKRLPSNNVYVTFYRRNLPHLQRDYKPHFVTFVTKHRLVLPDWARQIVFDCCTHDHNKKYNLRVVVIMPDHAHMILTPLTDETQRMIFRLPEIMKAIKGAS